MDGRSGDAAKMRSQSTAKGSPPKETNIIVIVVNYTVTAIGVVTWRGALVSTYSEHINKNMEYKIS